MKKPGPSPCFRLMPLLMGILSGSAAATEPEMAGLRFDSVQVLNLAAREYSPPNKDGRIAPVTRLSADAGAAIVAAPAMDEDESSLPPVSITAGCKASVDACVRRYEKATIGHETGQVSRTGKRLLIRPKAGPPVVFNDWSKPAGAQADGDGAAHLYAGRLGPFAYHRVEIQFAQDSPGSFLINPESGKTAFVHNGDDVAALAPDGLRLVTFNTLNPPLSIRVARLDGNGPAVELQCEAANTDTRAYASFKGWHDANAFDIVLKPSSTDEREATPVRLEFADGAWSIATPDSQRLERSFGLVCRNYPG